MEKRAENFFDSPTGRLTPVFKKAIAEHVPAMALSYVRRTQKFLWPARGDDEIGSDGRSDQLAAAILVLAALRGNG